MTASGTATSKPSDFTLTSPAFGPGEEIPARYTCDGSDISPPLQLGTPPDGTRSLMLVVDDPDAPDPAAPKRRWVHWVLYNLPPHTRSLPEAASRTTLPNETIEGQTDSGSPGYGGPCPPIGRHRYVFSLYAVDTLLPPGGALTRDEALRAIEGHVLAKAELIGTYQRPAAKTR